MTAKKVVPQTSAEERFERVAPGQGGSKFYAAPIKGYHQHWAIDRNGEVEELKRAGYVFVTKNIDQRDTPITISAGGGEKHYLMKIPQKYHDEYMAMGQKRNDQATRATAAAKEGEYIANGNNLAEAKERPLR